MEKSKYYFHGTAGLNGKKFNQMNILKILNEGYIVSRQESLYYSFGTCNKDNSVCLCDCNLEKKESFYSAYEMYILSGPSLVLDRNIKVIKPAINHFPIEEEWTNMYDEVRSLEKISLDHLVGITLPLVFLQNKWTDFINVFDTSDVGTNLADHIINTHDYFEKILELALTKYPNIFFKDIDTYERIDLKRVENTKIKLLSLMR